MRIFRIGDNRHPIWDGTGAAMFGGRWNSPGRPVIWLQESRTAILIVPSVIARLDANALVNPHHPEANKLVVALPEPIIWDKRLFEK